MGRRVKFSTDKDAGPSSALGAATAGPSPASAADGRVQECRVILERLPEGPEGCRKSLPPPPLPPAPPPRQTTTHDVIRECRVVLERLSPSQSGTAIVTTENPAADAAGNPTPAGGQHATRWKRALRSKIPVKQKAADGGQTPRPARGVRAMVLRKEFYQQLTAAKVTQRSALRRGRARRAKTPWDHKSSTGAGECSTPGSSTASCSAPQDRLLRITCFGEMIKELLRDGSGTADTFADYEKVVLRRWLELSEAAAATYLRLLGMKGPWMRGSSAILGQDVQRHFDDLEKAGFVSSAISQCEVKDVASLLRVDELESMCSDLGVPIARRTKLAILRALVHLHATDQAKANELQTKLRAALGGCVRVRAVPRDLVRRALLLLAAWLPAPADGRRLRTVRALLLRPVPALLELRSRDGAPLPQRCMFTNRQMAVEWEEMVELREQLEDAIAASNWPEVENLTEELLERYRAHLAASILVGEALSVRVLGSGLAEALSASSEVLRRDPDLAALTVETLEVLLGQRQHLQQRRASWAVALAAVLQTRRGDHQRAAELLVLELEDKGHRGAPRMTLEARARAILGGKGGAGSALTAEVQARLQRLIPEATPPPPFTTVIISATAMPGSAKSRGLKRVYVGRAAGADQDSQHLTVEERVMKYFAGKGFPQGVDDEGETLVSLALLSLWDAVYDSEVCDAWGSSCQDRPLDWATDHFWVARHEAMEQRLQVIEQRDGDVKVLAAALAAARADLDGTPSLVRWPLLKDFDIEVFLRCVTVPVFVAICRRLFLDFSSYRQGFPDLLLWNPQESKSLFVEVKGPRDAVSAPQAEWLNFLRAHGADVAVAEVRAR